MMERKSDISRLLDRLSLKKLITRTKSHDDKRASEIMLTEAGMTILNQIDDGIEKFEKEIIHLSKEEALQLSLMLDKARG